MKGTVRDTPRIPNHRARNHQLTIAWFVPEIWLSASDAWGGIRPLLKLGLKESWKNPLQTNQQMDASLKVYLMWEKLSKLVGWFWSWVLGIFFFSPIIKQVWHVSFWEKHVLYDFVCPAYSHLVRCFFDVQKRQVSHDTNTSRGWDGAVSWVHGNHKRRFSGAAGRVLLLMVQKSGWSPPGM